MKVDVQTAKEFLRSYILNAPLDELAKLYSEAISTDDTVVVISGSKESGLYFKGERKNTSLIEAEQVTFQNIIKGNGGFLISADEWKENCRSGGFIDYDGFGYLSTTSEFSNLLVQPSEWTRQFPDWVTHVLWFNK